MSRCPSGACHFDNPFDSTHDRALMSKTLRFWKTQGLGNDFVLVERPVTTEVARALCDRRLGVGGDGVLVLGPGSEGSQGAVTVWNSDGSPAELCGNGLRCAALHLADQGGLGEGAELVLDTGAGPKRCVLIAHRRRGDAIVSVEMGAPTLRRAEVPALGEGDEMIEEALEVGSARLAATAVGMGNPHAVVFGDFTDEQVRALGPELERHGRFPAGVNAGFAKMTTAGHLELTVWERGAGLTGACGSGACAAAVAACATSRATAGEPIVVRQPGGELTITVDAGSGPVVMTGAARAVFCGELDLDLLLSAV